MSGAIVRKQPVDQSSVHPHGHGHTTVTSPSKTLLPAPVASLVTTLTQTASFGVRVGTKVGGYAIAGARETTLTSLEITRVAVEAVLACAGKDLSYRRRDAFGRIEAERILEQSISSLHYTINSISFFASSAFYLSTAVLTSASTLSVQGLSTLDALLGSTESSRAVAAIIELIKDEFKRPNAGRENEVVGYMDLFSGTVGFVLLQRWGRRQTEREFRQRGGEEVIWDAVIDDKGFRADVVGTKKTTYHDHLPVQNDEPLRSGRPVSFVSLAGDEAIETIERGTGPELPDLPSLGPYRTLPSDEQIRQHITKQLPRGSHAVIASETVTAKTIRVDLYNADRAELSPPPGTVVVKEHCRSIDRGTSPLEQNLPSQTVVFRTALRRSSSSDTSDLHLTIPSTAHAHPDIVHEADEGIVMGAGSKPGPSMVPRRRPPSSGSNNGHGCSGSDPMTDHAPNLDTPASGSSWFSSPAGAPTANQKRTRRPAGPPSSASEMESAANAGHALSASDKEGESTAQPKPNKVRQIRNVLRQLSPTSSSARFESIPAAVASQAPPETERDVRSGNAQHKQLPPIPRIIPSAEGRQDKGLPHLPLLGDGQTPTRFDRLSPRSPPASASYSTPSYSIKDRQHEPVRHETSETYSSQHSLSSRPGSPTMTRTHSRTLSGMSKARSDRDISVWSPGEGVPAEAETAPRRRSRSFVSSLYSMATRGSETSLILALRGPAPAAGMFDDDEVLQALGTQGKVPGIFPDDHLVRNVRRYARFSSASYGSQFLRFMGLVAEKASSESASSPDGETDIHHEHTSFSQHTGLPADTILLSSFEDPHGGLGFSQSPATALPLTHFISLDRDAKAVVLTCRGTLGFEDVLTDMLCDFDVLQWRGTSYQVHKGIHASARRMLGGQGSRVMATLKTALEQFPEYGLILTGHSLGGAVASLLAILIAEPSRVEDSGALFTTVRAEKLLAHSDPAGGGLEGDGGVAPIALPPRRRIHVYAYGPPATLSPALRTATRGLITTIVNSNDIVPSLSLGILHDFRSVASSLKHDTTGAIAALKRRVWERVRHAAQSAFYVDGGGPPPVQNRAGDGLGEDNWAWSALQSLRQGMTNAKLVPPGEVFVVESSRVFDRQDGVMAAVATAAAATTTMTTRTRTRTTVAEGACRGGSIGDDAATERVMSNSLGRPATRVQMKLVRDVEGRFGELRFGSRMFSDHSPARYEAGLAALEAGVLEG